LAGKNADRVKSLDWQVRKAERKGKLSGAVLEEEVYKVGAILEG
jgi:mRNA interferase MazF